MRNASDEVHQFIFSPPSFPLKGSFYINPRGPSIHQTWPTYLARLVDGDVAWSISTSVSFSELLLMQTLARERLLGEGLVAGLDLISSAMGEEDAVISSNISSTYLEISENSLSIARQLVHRYGVVPGQHVVVECGGFAPAEVTALFACMRL